MDRNDTASQFLVEKWKPILNHPALPTIKDSYRRNVTAVLLENQERASQEQANNIVGGGMSPVVGGEGSIKGFDPVLISLVRRSMPKLLAYDICGVQPMTGPTGLIFAMKAKYSSQGGNEAFGAFEPYPSFSSGTTGSTGSVANLGDPLGTGAQTIGVADFSGAGVSGGLETATAETLGAAAGTQFPEMAFSIERTSVVAKTRALKAEYTTELAQDLKAIHGLDAETELANILSTEILAEINREIVRTVYRISKLGAQHSDLYYVGGAGAGLSAGSTGIGGIYDLDRDSDGRWSAERFRGLMFQIERESNQIAKDTRRGKGNILLCTSDVASALAMSGFLNISPAKATDLDVDDTGDTFVGTLNGKLKVYIDPYSSGTNYACVGYRGSSPYDAGLFYCPYVPLQMVRSIGQDDFQPRIGFKTRYGMVMNPFTNNDNTTSDLEPTSASAVRSNQYFRIFRIDGLHGGAVAAGNSYP